MFVERILRSSLNELYDFVAGLSAEMPTLSEH